MMIYLNKRYKVIKESNFKAKLIVGKKEYYSFIVHY